MKNMLKRDQSVVTPDGPGKFLGTEMRKNTNGGPGTRQARVQLENGKIRHYNFSKLNGLSI